MIDFNQAFQRVVAVREIIKHLTPIIENLVDEAEGFLPVKGQGAAKLEWVKAQVQHIFGFLEQSVVTFEQIWPLLEKFVALVVTFRNAVGRFKKD